MLLVVDYALGIKKLYVIFIVALYNLDLVENDARYLRSGQVSLK